MTDTVTAKLSKPISFNGETFTELTFRRTTVGDARRAGAYEDEPSQRVAIYASMAGVPMEAMDLMLASDFHRIVAEVDAAFATEESLGESPAAA